MRAALRALLVAVLLATAGCAGVFGPDRPPSDERALDQLNRSGAAVTDVDSYRYRVDGRVEASKGDEEASATIEGSGVVDVADRRMMVTLRSEGETQFGGDERRAYLLGRTRYTECPLAGWGRENLSAEDPWLSLTPVGRQLALLNETDVYWRGTRELDGQAANVVVAYPTKEELIAADTRSTDTTDLEGANVQNVTVRVWFDAATHRPLESRIEIDLRKDGATATVDLTTRFEEYGAPVNVTPPAFGSEGYEIREFGC